MDQVDQDYYKEIMQNSSSDSKTTVSVKDDGTTHEDIQVSTRQTEQVHKIIIELQHEIPNNLTF